MNREEMQETFREVLVEVFAADDTQRRRNEFVDLLIEERRRRQERWEAVRRQVMGWAAIAMIVAVLAGIGYYAADQIDRLSHRHDRQDSP